MLGQATNQKPAGVGASGGAMGDGGGLLLG